MAIRKKRFIYLILWVLVYLIMFGYGVKPKAQTTEKIEIGVSLSMPLSLIQYYLQNANSNNASVYLKGFPQGEKIDWYYKVVVHSLLEEGLTLQELSVLQLNPVFFAKYDVKTVPFFVIRRGEKIYQIQGSIGFNQIREQIKNENEKNL